MTLWTKWESAGSGPAVFGENHVLVDGASRLQAFRRITLRLALPGIIVTSIFAFVFSWNNVLFPLVLIKQATATLPVGTISFFASTGVYWNQIAATAVVAMPPPMVIFLALGRYVVRGLTDEDLLLAADYARREGLYDRAINTAERTSSRHDFGLRYLMPFKEQFTAAAREHSVDPALLFSSRARNRASRRTSCLPRARLV